MPRGIPASGKRASGGGRKQKFAEETVVARIPASLARNLEDVVLFLGELDVEIATWEDELQGKDMAKNPRWSKAKELALSIREKLDALGIGE